MAQLIFGLQSLSKNFNSGHSRLPCVVTVGNFDGFHLGHQALVRKLVDKSKYYKTPTVVITFSPHPTEILQPHAPSTRMFNNYDQSQILQAYGVDILVEEPFDQNYADLTPEQFFKEKLLSYLEPRCLVVGYDFCFGKNRVGNTDYLRGLCERAGLEFVVEPAQLWEGSPISSSRIRECLKRGEMQKVTAMLGRYYSLRGLVQRGNQRGRKLGFPTANIQPKLALTPPYGVYASKIKFQNRWIEGITNIGMSPTFHSEGKPMVWVETHMFDWQGEIYGEEIEVQFLEFIRPEMKFSGPNDLVKQIEKDLLIAKRILAYNTV